MRAERAGTYGSVIEQLYETSGAEAVDPNLMQT